MSINDHGNCKNCGFDLNGEWVYDYFLEEYKNPVDALAVASMYGASPGKGRFGKSIYMKLYDDNGKKLPTWWMCPECKQECY